MVFLFKMVTHYLQTVLFPLLSAAYVFSSPGGPAKQDPLSVSAVFSSCSFAVGTWRWVFLHLDLVADTKWLMKFMKYFLCWGIIQQGIISEVRD